MGMKTSKISLLLIGMVFIFQSCATETNITGSWKNTEAKTNQINSVLVTALTEKANVRQTVEDDLAKGLREKGYKASRSIDVMPPKFTQNKELDKEELLEKIKKTNIDAILTVALLDKDTETRYVPGTYGYTPVTRFGYYGRFLGYYNTWYPTVYSPGYYSEDKIYFIEANLYDAKTEELLWSAQSETYNPDNLRDFSKNFANVVIAKMEKDGILQKK